MALTGKDVLDALGIDETHESNIELPTPAERIVSLRKEGVLLDLQRIAKRSGGTAATARVSRSHVRCMIDEGRRRDEQHGVFDIEESLGINIRFAVQEIYVKLEALLDLADEA